MSRFEDSVNRLNRAGEAEADRRVEHEREQRGLAERAAAEANKLLRECAAYLSSKAQPQRVELADHKLWNPSRSPAGFVLYQKSPNRNGSASLTLLTPDGRLWTYLQGARERGDYRPITADTLIDRNRFIDGKTFLGFDLTGIPTACTSAYEATSVPLESWLATVAAKF